MRRWCCHLEQNAAASSDGHVLEGLLRAHAPNNFHCQCSVAVYQLHDVTGIQLVALHPQQQRKDKRMKRP
jgi:hypothetical protein